MINENIEKTFKILNDSLESLESLLNIRELYKEKHENREIKRADIDLLNLSFFYISKSIGANYSSPSIESYKSIYSESDIALESVNRFVKKVWVKIKHFFLYIRDLVINKIKESTSIINKTKGYVDSFIKLLKEKGRGYDRVLYILNEDYGNATFESLGKLFKDKGNIEELNSISIGDYLTSIILNYKNFTFNNVTFPNATIRLIAPVVNENGEHLYPSVPNDYIDNLNSSLNSLISDYNNNFLNNIKNLTKFDKNDSLVGKVKKDFIGIQKSLEKIDQEFTSLIKKHFIFHKDDKLFFARSTLRPNEDYIYDSESKEFSFVESRPLKAIALEYEKNNIKEFPDLLNILKEQRELANKNKAIINRNIVRQKTLGKLTFNYSDELAKINLPESNKLISLFEKANTSINKTSKINSEINKAISNLKKIMDLIDVEEGKGRRGIDFNILFGVIRECNICFNYIFNSTSQELLKDVSYLLSASVVFYKKLNDLGGKL